MIGKERPDEKAEQADKSDRLRVAMATEDEVELLKIAHEVGLEGIIIANYRPKGKLANSKIMGLTLNVQMAKAAALLMEAYLAGSGEDEIEIIAGEMRGVISAEEKNDAAKDEKVPSGSTDSVSRPEQKLRPDEGRGS